ncbi:MAG TPA: RDD family protein [Actinomycetota bacterium]
MATARPGPERPRMVTPEAVALDFRTANVGSRLLAYALDILVIGVVIVAVVLMVVLSGTTLPQWLAVASAAILIPAWYFGYFIALETLWRGRTLGKAALGLRVVTREGGPVRFRHAAVRALLGLVDFVASGGFLAVAFILLGRDNQRLGDIVAGTLVLRERSALPAPAPASFEPPSGLRSYTVTLDVSGLANEEYQTLRSFLLRATSLRPAPRAALAQQLATPLAARLRPPPPAGVSPETYLACVAAAVQQRQRLAAGPARPLPVPAAPQPGAPAPIPAGPLPPADEQTDEQTGDQTGEQGDGGAFTPPA